MKLPEKVQKIIKDIADLKIQGATNVGLAVYEGLEHYIKEYPQNNPGQNSFDLFMCDVEKAAILLANARPNEPLARNGVKFVFNMFKIKHPGVEEIPLGQEKLLSVMSEYDGMLRKARTKIVERAVNDFSNLKGVLTHCHSSTAVGVFKGIAEKKKGQDFSIISTETRPLFQGRITSKSLVDAGLDVTMIVDNAVTSFLAGEWGIPVDAVFVGCDQINIDGGVINKVGSYGVALAAYYKSKPLYVVSTLLKMDPATIYDKPEIEMRSPDEVWPDAPHGLKIINPAFEIVPPQLITGFVTEVGVLKPQEVEAALGQNYDWMW